MKNEKLRIVGKHLHTCLNEPYFFNGLKNMQKMVSL